MPTELLSLIALHFACNAVAETRHISTYEAVACTRVYTEVKLAFVDGMDFEEYASLSPAERFEINKMGYLAYLAWKNDHPAMVDHLHAVARGDVRLAVEG